MWRLIEMKRNLVKKIFAGVLFFVMPFFLFSETVSSMQLFKSDSWIYESLDKLGRESGVVSVTFNAPLSAGELRFFFKQIDQDKLSESGKILYDQVEEFLYEKPKNFSFSSFFVSPNLRVTPEFYFRTNKNIPLTHEYYYKDNSVAADVMLGFSDYALFDMEVFLGKNHGAMHKPDNFTNLIFDIGDAEFQTPTWTNFTAGYNFKDWGINFTIAKEGLQVGRSLTGSIVYNDTFKTDMYGQLNIFTDVFKFTQNVVEVARDKFYYNHQFEVRLFKKLKINVGEAVLVYGSFEPRFLIPLTMYHSYAAWHDYDEAGNDYYSESNFCNTMNIMLEYAPFANTRFYIYYMQNELQVAWEAAETPNSFGFQVGAELSFNAPANGYWNVNAEWVWTTPYLYVKHGAPWSLYRDYHPNHTAGTGGHVYSWIGSPFGPDCMAGALKFGYEKPGKWRADLQWVFSAHGEKDFDMFNQTITDGGKEWYYYYPAVIYYHDTDPDKREAAKKDALNLLPSGTVEYKNEVTLSGTYTFNKHFSLSGEAVYIFAYNFDNISGNFQQGAQFSISGTYTLF